MPPCLIGMEACVGAHHLSRKLTSLGHDARLMPAKYVRPRARRARKKRSGANANIDLTTELLEFRIVLAAWGWASRGVAHHETTYCCTGARRCIGNGHCGGTESGTGSVERLGLGTGRVR